MTLWFYDSKVHCSSKEEIIKGRKLGALCFPLRATEKFPNGFEKWFPHTVSLHLKKSVVWLCVLHCILHHLHISSSASDFPSCLLACSPSWALISASIWSPYPITKWKILCPSLVTHPESIMAMLSAFAPPCWRRITADKSLASEQGDVRLPRSSSHLILNTRSNDIFSSSARLIL